MDYGFAFVVCLKETQFGSHWLQQKQSWTKAAPGARQAQDSALSLNGPVLLPVSGSNFRALSQPELSVAFAPGYLNICLQGR